MLLVRFWTYSRLSFSSEYLKNRWQKNLGVSTGDKIYLYWNFWVSTVTMLDVSTRKLSLPYRAS